MDFPIRTLEKSEWPPLLEHIPDPPKLLYLRGALPPAEHTYLAVVGSRQCSVYGKEAVRRLIAGLKGYPITIVSGLALGIDALAHEAALSAKLHTIAVPGSGIDDSVIYPRTHKGLARKILESGGGLLSEFEPTFVSTTWAFPQRNRIMAGLSKATLVVEASLKSGTLITSRLATEYNRDVLTIPGSIFSAHSAGPHMLIRLGATPITESRDILEALGIREQSDTQIPLDLSAVEQRIYDALAEPCTRDELAVRTQLPIPELNMHVTLLELRNVLSELNGVLIRSSH